MVKILIPCHHTTKGDEATVTCMIKSLEDSIENAEFTVLADYSEIASLYLQEKNIQVLNWFFRREEWYPLLVPLKKFPKLMQIAIEESFTLKAILNMFLGLLWMALNSTGLNIPLLKQEKRRILKEFMDADVVLFSPGGSYIGDLMGEWLPVYLYHMLLAQVLRKPTMIYAPSIGPFKRTKSICRRFLNGVQVIAVRDPVSMAYLKELNLRKPQTYLTADCALLQTPADNGRVEEIMRSLKLPRNNSLLVGITVKGEEQTYDLRKWTLYKQTLASAADYLIKNHNALVVFIPHAYEVTSEVHVINEVVELMSRTERIRILPEDCSADEVQGVLARLNLLIATRLHSFVLGTAVCTPAILVVYEHKGTGFAEMLGLSEFIVRVDALDSHELFAKIDRLLKNSEKLRAQIASKLPSLKERAMFNAKLATQLLRSNTEHV